MAPGGFSSGIVWKGKQRGCVLKVSKAFRHPGHGFIRSRIAE